nr:hypothetical protein [uncultured Gellertiella sp.]
MATIVVELSEDAAGRLDRIARTSLVPRAILAGRAIEYFVDNEEWQVGEIASGLSDALEGRFASEEDASTLFRAYLE